MNGFTLPSGRERSTCYLKSFTTVLGLPLPTAHIWIILSLTIKCLYTIICTFYEELLCTFISPITINFLRKSEWKMVKQKVKQLQIEGLSKSTEPKWVFLKRLPLALTLARPPIPHHPKPLNLYYRIQTLNPPRNVWNLTVFLTASFKFNLFLNIIRSWKSGYFI